MQDKHSIEMSGGSRRLFAIEGDLKCPRCESLNTKFCYYNNYNFCQPRHFCRSCRRYWTKGGVLRYVPVGGGIRKVKRSGKLKSKTSVPSENSNSNRLSLSAITTSANVTETTTTGMTTTDSSSTNSTPSILLDFNEPSTRFFNFSLSSTQLTTIDQLMMNQSSSGRNISPEIGMFKVHQQNQLQWTQTGRIAEIDSTGLESRRSDGTALARNGDSQDSVNQGLFDQSYSIQNHWNDDDHDHRFSYLS